MLYITFFPSSLFVCPCPRFTCHPLSEGGGVDWGCFGLVWHGFVAFAKPLLGACRRLSVARGLVGCTFVVQGSALCCPLVGDGSWVSMPVACEVWLTLVLFLLRSVPGLRDLSICLVRWAVTSWLRSDDGTWESMPVV